MTHKTVLITGAARRIGAEIARAFHRHHYNVIVHYHRSQQEALVLAESLNSQRPNSVKTIAFDLLQTAQYDDFKRQILNCWERLDVLVNNASTYYPTPVASEADWQDLIGTNVKAPCFLIDALKDELSKQQGSVVNLSDINACTGRADYTIYCAAKAGLEGLTKAYDETLPQVSVSSFALGPTLPPEGAAAVSPEAYEVLLKSRPAELQLTVEEVAEKVVQQTIER